MLELGVHWMSIVYRKKGIERTKEKSWNEGLR